MGDLTPLIEGLVKFRDGKKWKQRFASITRLSPVADSLTLQLWRDKKDWEKNPPSKGSIALQDYLGWEAGFTLDKESLTLALILKETILVLAFDSRETLLRWQVRVTSQFEEGQHVNAHLLQIPPKSKFPTGPVKIHLQNRRFSITHGIPPKLMHSWDLVDLRRYGALENGRFCFEGGSRCSKGEGLHALRVDNPEELKTAFDLASKGKLESNRRKTIYRNGHGSPSCSSGLDLHSRQMSHSSDLSAQGSSAELVMIGDEFSRRVRRQSSRDDLTNHSRSRSRSINTSANWSSTEGQSSCETMSVALSEMTDGSMTGSKSPDHLVNRRALLERVGMVETSESSRRNPSRSDLSYPQWSMQRTRNLINSNCSSSYSVDRLSNSSHESSASNGMNLPSKQALTSPRLTPKTQRRIITTPDYSSLVSSGSPQTFVSQPPNHELQRVLASTPAMRCQCSHRNSAASSLSSVSFSGSSSCFDNYDIPRSLGNSQDAALNYDTPRSLKFGQDNSDQPSSNPYANYDYPQNGSVPVVNKDCGCIAKPSSTSSDSTFLPAAPVNCSRQSQVSLTPEPGAQPNIKFKLTGTGKMPVADLRNLSADDIIASGYATKEAPVYAVVNKAKKSTKKVDAKKSPEHNYCNIAPSDQRPNFYHHYENMEPVMMKAGSGKTDQRSVHTQDERYYENTRALLERLELNEYLESNHKGNQGLMEPMVMSQGQDHLPPFECDSINRKLRNFHDSLVTHCQGLPGSSAASGALPPGSVGMSSASGHSKAFSRSSDQLLMSAASEENNKGGAVTMPRSSGSVSSNNNKPSEPNVTMRRSSSVPCKKTSIDRGSTSSSDSGFSPGSPSNPTNH